MNIFVIILFSKLSFAALSNRTTTKTRFVKERALYSTPHTTVSEVKSSIECGMLCGRKLECCGYTPETPSCHLFDYHTSNNCQNTTDGSVELQYVKEKITDCSELLPDLPSGVYEVYPSRQTAVLVYCEMTDAVGGWTVLQRRMDGSEDFYRDWAGYKEGFGDLENEFWLGNDIIHMITSQKHYKVRFDLVAFDNQTAYAEYKSFYVDNEGMNYGLNISGYSGTAGGPNEFDYGWYGILRFSTRDVDNDAWSNGSCGVNRRSGWWHDACTNYNINGLYGPGVDHWRTMYWYLWKDHVGLRKTRMMIKPAI